MSIGGVYSKSLVVGHDEEREIHPTIHPAAMRLIQLLSEGVKTSGGDVGMLNVSLDTSAVDGRRSFSSKPQDSESVKSESSGSTSLSFDSSATSSVTCICATPPKKSVIRVSFSGRLNRSVRMPLCDRMASGSYMLNYKCTASVNEASQS